jgi:carbamoyl-phosphate synthase small subunit
VAQLGPAKLALEDGSVFEGLSCGAAGERQGEVVFNTAMTGYQEVLTDPSYKGQIVVMTYPHIGNYGVNREDVESSRAWVEGFVAREFARAPSNWRSTQSLDDYLRESGVVGLDGIDTRAVTHKLRVTGSLNGVISTVDLDDQSLVDKARRVPKMSGLDLVRFVTRKSRARASELIGTPAAAEFRFRVALIDCGAKLNIVRLLTAGGCDVTVYPAQVEAGDLLGGGYDGVCLSNGPGDPNAVTYTIRTIRELLSKEVPLFGICLGHQILGCAAGASVYKLKFGHHGANHPVQNVRTGTVEITSQNHGFAVEAESASEKGFEVTHINLNDRTVEGMKHRSRPIFSVQYHPEAAPGPHDSRYLFDEFLRSMETCKVR